jgi:hypothetical protein
MSLIIMYFLPAVASGEVFLARNSLADATPWVKTLLG